MKYLQAFPTASCPMLSALPTDLAGSAGGHEQAAMTSLNYNLTHLCALLWHIDLVMAAYGNSYVVKPGTTMSYGSSLPTPSTTLGEISHRVCAQVHGALQEDASEMNANDFLSRLSHLPCSPESKERIASRPTQKPQRQPATATTQDFDVPMATTELMHQSQCGAQGYDTTIRCGNRAAAPHEP